MSVEERIANIRDQSGVAFGTSGARGLASAISDKVAYCYTTAFLQHLRVSRQYSEAQGSVAIAGDLRPSTPRIMLACAQAVKDFGLEPIACGFIPSPAVALYGISKAIPSIMVTGSHIPEDRNGIKFTTPAGEITKTDEAGIVDKAVFLPDSLFGRDGFFIKELPGLEQNSEAETMYLRRYTECLPPTLLKGLHIGLYQHSAVGRDLLAQMYRGLGAEVTLLGRASGFVPVDTEAIREEDQRLASKWAAENKLDSIVSTDGDSDRPLISDERGAWIRGDVAGILCAKALGVEALATPVSCSTAAEKSSLFKQVLRTRIGSPYVIEGMAELAALGHSSVAGYEANGGFLLHTQAKLNDFPIASLPTRDAVIVHLALLSLAKEKQSPLSEIIKLLPQRFTDSGRLKEYPTARSAEVIAKLKRNKLKLAREAFLPLAGELKEINETDGLRLTFEGGNIIHLRPSGNAPEFRCYSESDSVEQAAKLRDQTLDILRSL